MLADQLDVIHVLPAANSWLHREVQDLGLTFTPVSSKAEACVALERLVFDVFVSTGFPYILPISQLLREHPNAKFVNVHPSLLPDLRGADPIPGAVLFRRDSGVTCHLMDDSIDTGPIISQERIPYFDGLDAKLLYFLAFSLEPEVFRMAYACDFRPVGQQQSTSGSIYYSFKAEDLNLDLERSNEDIISRVRAFNTPNKGALLCISDTTYRIFDATAIIEPQVVARFGAGAFNEVAGIVEDSILIARRGQLLRFSGVQPGPSLSLVGKVPAG